MTVPWTLFFDIETTGLDPSADALLEYGAVLVDSHDRVVLERTRVIRYTAEQVGRLYMYAHPRVQEMHTVNGLWADLYAVAAGSTTPAAIDIQALECDLDPIIQACPHPKRTVIGGFSPHFDRSWLEVYAPTALGRLSHRNFDVSTLRHTVQDVHGCWEPDLGDVPHRGLGDSVRALEYYRWYKSMVMKGTG